jgi:ABC-2 type transport system ATP-binding protein
MDSKNEVYWGSLAETYDMDIEAVIGKDERAKIFEAINGLKGLGNVVEFGCGPGFFTGALAHNAEKVLATDISEKMLNVARKNLKGHDNVSFKKMDCESTGLPDEKYDTVFMANIIEILEEPEMALRESYRILRHGGRLIMLFYTDYGLGAFSKFRLYIRLYNKFKIPPNIRFFSPDTTRVFVENAGFTIEKLSLIGDYIKAVFLIAKKP